MRVVMPLPPLPRAAIAEAALPGPARGNTARWLSLLILSVSVSLTGAATGYSTSHLRRATAVRADRPAAVERPAVTARFAEILPMVLRRPMPLTVFADGKVVEVKSRARTAPQVLSQVGLTLGPGDRLFPAADTSLWSSARVRVVRIRRAAATRRVLLPVPTVRKLDPTIPRGMVRTTAGRPGVKVQRFNETFADGRLVSTVYLGQEVVQPAVPRVIRTGTLILVASRGAFKGYEYMTVEATAYAPWHGKGVDGTTAIGLRAGYGVVAVDPRVIPLRSILYIDGYGRAIAGDTGGAIKGMRIDLGMDTVRAAKQFGRRPVRVYILKKGQPRKSRQAHTRVK